MYDWVQVFKIEVYDHLVHPSAEVRSLFLSSVPLSSPQVVSLSLFPLRAPPRTLIRTRRQESSWARKRSQLHARRSSARHCARRRGSSQLLNVCLLLSTREEQAVLGVASSPWCL
jgi:hypothetical protein